MEFYSDASGDQQHGNGCWSNGKAMSLDMCNVAPLFEKFKRFDFVKVRKHDGSLAFDEYSSYITEFMMIVIGIFSLYHVFVHGH